MKKKSYTPCLINWKEFQPYNLKLSSLYSFFFLYCICNAIKQSPLEETEAKINHQN